MVTDAGQLIRMPVKDVRIAGRNTMGVIMFRIADDEKVVSAIAVEDDDDETETEGIEGSSQVNSLDEEAPLEAPESAAQQPQEEDAE